jgi:2-keto-4-pentenoate hydratase
VQGHPLDSAAWLANELLRLGVMMKAGQLIAAGTCTGLHIAKAGTVVTSDFGPYGTVRINVTA